MIDLPGFRRGGMLLKSKILQSLHEDHANQLQLLSLIELEIGKLTKIGRAANFEMISLALEYCVDFPGRYHHPKEDLIYETLIKRDPDIAIRAIALTEEHHKLNALTREFATAVGEAIDGKNVNHLQLTADRFLKLYRCHIDIEEAEVFPRVNRALTKEDWIAIDQAYSDSNDPLFGEHTRQSYIVLQQRIVERAALS